jgi:hypothetical protein
MGKCPLLELSKKGKEENGGRDQVIDKEEEAAVGEGQGWL